MIIIYLTCIIIDLVNDLPQFGDAACLFQAPQQDPQRKHDGDIDIAVHWLAEELVHQFALDIVVLAPGLVLASLRAIEVVEAVVARHDRTAQLHAVPATAMALHSLTHARRVTLLDEHDLTRVDVTRSVQIAFLAVEYDAHGLVGQLLADARQWQLDGCAVVLALLVDKRRTEKGQLGGPREGLQILVLGVDRLGAKRVVARLHGGEGLLAAPQAQRHFALELAAVHHDRDDGRAGGDAQAPLAVVEAVAVLADVEQEPRALGVRSRLGLGTRWRVPEAARAIRAHRRVHLPAVVLTLVEEVGLSHEACRFLGALGRW